MSLSEKQRLPVLAVFLLLTVQLASNISVEALCLKECKEVQVKTIICCGGTPAALKDNKGEMSLEVG